MVSPLAFEIPVPYPVSGSNTPAATMMNGFYTPAAVQNAVTTAPVSHVLDRSPPVTPLLRRHRNVTTRRSRATVVEFVDLTEL